MSLRNVHFPVLTLQALVTSYDQTRSTDKQSTLQLTHFLNDTHTPFRLLLFYSSMNNRTPNYKLEMRIGQQSAVSSQQFSSQQAFSPGHYEVQYNL